MKYLTSHKNAPATHNDISSESKRVSCSKEISTKTARSTAHTRGTHASKTYKQIHHLRLN